jgi:hypothetical protein
MSRTNTSLAESLRREAEADRGEHSSSSKHQSQKDEFKDEMARQQLRNVEKGQKEALEKDKTESKNGKK